MSRNANFRIISHLSLVIHIFLNHRTRLFNASNLCWSLFSVGYDTTKMLLRGKFSYERENQRTLPFNVDIRELPETKTIFVGDSSK